MARWRVLWRFAPKQNKDVDVKSKVSQWSQAMQCAMCMLMLMTVADEVGHCTIPNLP